MIFCYGKFLSFQTGSKLYFAITFFQLMIIATGRANGSFNNYFIIS